MADARNQPFEIAVLVHDLEQKIAAYLGDADDSGTAWPVMELGDALVDLGDCLKSRARRVIVPSSGWMPEMAASPQHGVRVAHWTGAQPVRRGLAFMSACGAACYPFYGRDTENKIATHPACADCEQLAGEPQAGTAPD
ncbi:hypothetical protein L3Q65_24500 [Amycolatopsis sp. FU40]|uniref:hypothetical protein n=1 Tax=Amycolatopsis sp. FU40 TaxID=2914159 RepID=UPI001F1BE360|nr:hypothetical protein [Amycolatopsis sp. FU40]UKD51092.1 hypothetical protein L3Q65_24500 [Amycolatopsis sp. FU40]